MDDQSDAMFNPVVGVGHPDFQSDLGGDDEKRIDEKGALVVLGLPWSEAATGLYLAVYLVRVNHAVRLGSDRQILGRTLGLPPQADGIDRALGIFVSRGKPAWNLPGHGAALELPSDLAQDALKVKYVTEWFIDTVKEAALADGVELASFNSIAGEMIVHVERAIRAAGL